MVTNLTQNGLLLHTPKMMISPLKPSLVSSTQKLLLYLLLLAAPLCSSAQLAYFNSETFWGKLQLQEMQQHPEIDAVDTVIIVASNRASDSNSYRFLPEKRDGKQTKYYVVYTKGGKWKVQPVYGLGDAISLMPDRNKSWVVYTEGMGKFFTTGVDRGMNMAAQYGVNVILLDYPSISAHKKPLGNYFFAKRNAALAQKDFLPVLDSIKQLQQRGTLGNVGVQLFFHSMGNIMLRQIIKKQQLARLNDTKWVQHLILNAPCIPQKGHKKLLEKIDFANQSFIHYNPEDITLAGAYLVSKRYQLGKQVRKPISQKIQYINFNTLVQQGHSYFLHITGRHEIPEAAKRHYHALLHGRNINLADTALYKASGYRGIGYDILP